MEVKPLMTRKEFASLLCIDVTTLRGLIKSGEIHLVGSKIPAREYYKLLDPKAGDPR